MFAFDFVQVMDNCRDNATREGDDIEECDIQSLPKFLMLLMFLNWRMWL